MNEMSKIEKKLFANEKKRLMISVKAKINKQLAVVGSSVNSDLKKAISSERNKIGSREALRRIRGKFSRMKLLKLNSFQAHIASARDLKKY